MTKEEPLWALCLVCVCGLRAPGSLGELFHGEGCHILEGASESSSVDADAKRRPVRVTGRGECVWVCMRAPGSAAVCDIHQESLNCSLLHRVCEGVSGVPRSLLNTLMASPGELRSC